MSKAKDLIDFKNLLHRLETEGKELSGTDVLLDIIYPEKFPYETRHIVQEIVSIIDDNPEFVDMIPDKLKKFFSSYNIFLKGENKMSKAKELIKLFERLPSGFSIEEFDVDVSEEKFTFMVSFPKTAAKGLEPPDTNVVYVKGSGDIDVSYDKPYRGSIEGPPGGGWEIDVSYVGGFFFVDDDGKETKIDQKQSKIVNDILNRNFEDEFLDRIEDEFEEDRTAYKGD